ncbi:diaminopimelate epimerase [Thiomicrospira microaerophila]|uniref:diaminopimelate epimerase n=1 Tax=Thiomicrospira microaerophila TaxID=406020 RepID=UPI00200CCF33|nr:diaminopimelate epimerase [Thiomicrospira microaerophila]UQB42798.1 diaminopimelate epimerase [Thiomicrospira microaerophila]
MGLRFTKMHGLGNDFMVIDALSQTVEIEANQVRDWANRHTGVGFDQLLLVEKSLSEQADFRYRIFNADGSEVQQCGNGARCFARFVFDQGLTDKREIPVETASGLIVLYLEPDGQVRVNMGAPRFAPQALPFITQQQALSYQVEVNNQAWSLGAVSMGNPHAVLEVEDIDLAPVATLGSSLECHPRFPERVNVGFAQVIDRQRVKLRVFERGAGETQACGTGACAAMAVLRLWDRVDDSVTVSLPGGDLVIRWSGSLTDPLWMTGPVARVFEGVMTNET